YFVYQSTLHVPLIIHWPAGAKRFPLDRVDEAASLLDVAPSILDAIGLPRPSAMRGRSLSSARSTEEIYSESLYARNQFGGAALRSLRVGRYKYIDAPKPELYDLSNDPGELQNLYEQQRSRAMALGERITALRSSSPLGRSSNPPSPAREFRRALDEAPSNARAHFDLGLCYFRLRQPDDAVKELQAALALEPWYTRAEELLADTYIQKKDYPQARAHLDHLLSIDPNN